MQFSSTRLVALLVFSLAAVSIAHAERYSVEKDSFGNFSAKKVESSDIDSADKEPAEGDSTRAERTQERNDSNPDLSQVSENQEPSELESRQKGSSGPVTDADPDSAGAPGQYGSESEQEKIEPRKLSIFEQKYIEAELAERARILKGLKPDEDVQSDYDATKVNPEDFIDSEEFLRSGSKPEKERSPYYVTVDADGIQHTTFYDPNLVKEILFAERNKKIEFTEAQVFQKSESEISVPGAADPIALSILSSGKDSFVSYFDAFSEKCCAQLPNIETPEITLGNYHYFVLNDDTLPYRFAEGDSRFLLLRLPDLNKATIPLRIRTFIRRFAKQNIEKGVFFPQLITLDKDKKPLRIITGPLLKFQDETWTTHAYLQGIFAMSQTKELDERYLLINTTGETLKSNSTIEIPASEDGIARTVIIQHMNEGSLEIEILE